ncbi:MAG: hypothetical protein JWO91_1784 [Acidobacteriaceae bacterium]|nr:hypothetical protein [Acidobacteriaceae bacterium]
MNDQRQVVVLLSAVLICTTVNAADFKQELAEARAQQNSAHKFWNRTNTILLSTHAGLEALDFGITHHHLAEGGKEMNSMAKALCEKGTGGQLVFFGGRTVGVIAIIYLLHRMHQHKMERGFILYASADSLYGVGYSFAHR